MRMLRDWKLKKESVEIIVFPASGTVIAVKLTLSPVEFTRVNSSPPVIVNLLRHHRVEHFMVDDVFEEPGWNKWRIQ